MNRHVEEIIYSIIEEFAVGASNPEALEAKTLFRLLNFCPPDRLLPERKSRTQLDS